MGTVRVVVRSAAWARSAARSSGRDHGAPKSGAPYVLFIALLAAACGGNTPTSPGNGGTPNTPTTLAGSVSAYGLVNHDHAPTASGQLTITLTWSGAADLDLYLTAPTCTGYPPDACVLLARSTASTGNREQVTITATAGTALRLWVDNFSRSTSAAYTITMAQ